MHLVGRAPAEGILYEREAVYEFILKEKQRISKVRALDCSRIPCWTLLPALFCPWQREK